VTYGERKKMEERLEEHRSIWHGAVLAW